MPLFALTHTSEFYINHARKEYVIVQRAFPVNPNFFTLGACFFTHVIPEAFRIGSRLSDIGWMDEEYQQLNSSTMGQDIVENDATWAAAQETRLTTEGYVRREVPAI